MVGVRCLVGLDFGVIGLLGIGFLFQRTHVDWRERSHRCHDSSTMTLATSLTWNTGSRVLRSLEK